MNLKKDSLEITNRLFITTQADKFERHLKKMDESTRHLIGHNKELNELYDLFLDFIIDSNQHLDSLDNKIKELDTSITS